MTLTKEEREIMVSHELRKAKLNIEQADANAKFGYWDLVANRLYYASFHAVSALLIKDGHAISSHKGAVLMFGKHYVKTGKVNVVYGRLYSQLQTMREKSDYNCSYDASEGEVSPMLSPAKELIEKIEQLLQD